MKNLLWLNLFLLLLLFGCKKQTGIKINIENKTDQKITYQAVAIKISELPKMNLNELVAFEGNKQLPTQLVDSDGDGKTDEYLFLINLEAKDSKIITLKKSEHKKIFKQRAHAEISEKRDYKLVDGVYTGGKFVSVKRTKTPKGHVDHNLYYKCEGPCWESDKVAYRFYIDQRNATDIFGKKVNDIILPNIGHTYDKSGNETYHTMANWGMDIFKVGNSLGIGSFAAFVNNKVEMITKRDSVISLVTNDGPIYASVKTNYFGWHVNDKKIDVEINLSIVAGSRLTKCEAVVSNQNLLYCTGLSKHNGTELLKSTNSNKWNYIALWGKQSLSNDNLGTIIFYNKDYQPNITEDNLSYIVTFTSLRKKIKYYYAACWEQEVNGIKNKKEFLRYLNYEIEKLNKPIKLSIK